MLKSFIVSMALASLAVTAFSGLAQAYRKECAMPIMKGGCPVVVTTQTGPYLPNPRDN